MYFVTGISLHELIYDFSNGIRLPNPSFCPSPIENLFEKCFCESPDKRPDFEEIKLYLLDAYNYLDSRSQQAKDKDIGIKNEELYTLVNSNLKYITIKEQYKTVLQENKLLRERKQVNNNYSSCADYTSMSTHLPHEEGSSSITSISSETETHSNSIEDIDYDSKKSEKYEWTDANRSFSLKAVKLTP